jgi:penicillin-binding protein 1A
VSQGRRRQLLAAGLLGAGAGVAVALGQSVLVQGLDSLLPNVRRLSNYSRPGTVTVLSADGQVIQKLGPATREKVAAGQMPLLVQRAFIAAEDRRFYQHDAAQPQAGFGGGGCQHDHPAAGPHRVPQPGPDDPAQTQ